MFAILPSSVWKNKAKKRKQIRIYYLFPSYVLPSGWSLFALSSTFAKSVRFTSTAAAVTNDDWNHFTEFVCVVCCAPQHCRSTNMLPGSGALGRVCVYLLCTNISLAEYVSCSTLASLHSTQTVPFERSSVRPFWNTLLLMWTEIDSKRHCSPGRNGTE